jgi:hypothetical protein
MEIYNEETHQFDVYPSLSKPIYEHDEEEYDDEEDYYDTMSEGSYESITNNKDDDEDEYEDDLYIPYNNDKKTRPTFLQDIVCIQTMLQNKSYLDKKRVDDVVEEEIVSASVAPWKDFETETVQNLEDIVKETELKKIEEVSVIVVEEEFDLRRLVRHHNRSPSNRNNNNKSFTKHVSPPAGEIDKTRLCKFGKRCVSKNKCDRVHTLDEWDPNMCHYDKKCRILKKCRFLHTRETKPDYLKRIIQQEDNKFYFGNQHLYLKNFGIQLNDKER